MRARWAKTAAGRGAAAVSPTRGTGDAQARARRSATQRCARCHGPDGTGAPHGGSVDRSVLPRAGERPGAAHRRRGWPPRSRHAGLARRRVGDADEPHRRSSTWSRGWRQHRSAGRRMTREPMRTTQPARGVAADARHRAQRRRGHAARGSARRLRALAGAALVVAAVDLARAADGLPGEPDAAGDATAIRSRVRGTARRRTSRAGCGASRATSSRCSRSTARISAARCAGSRSRACSCARATAASTTPTASTPRGRRRAALYQYESQDRGRPALGARRRSCRRCRRPVLMGALPRPVGDWLDERLGLGDAARGGRPTPPRAARHRRAGGTSSAAPRSSCFVRAGRDRHLPRDRLRAVGRRRVAEPRGPQLRAAARLVPARGARLGLELHGRADDAST